MWDILWKPNISNKKGIKLLQNATSQTCYVVNLPMHREIVKSSTYQRRTTCLIRHNFYGQGIGISIVYKYQVIFINRQVFKTLVDLDIKYKWFKMTEKRNIKIGPWLIFQNYFLSTAYIITVLNYSHFFDFSMQFWSM